MGVGLYEHQREAVDKMRSGSVLCGGVGSGKSRTALAFFVEKICGGRIPSARSSESPVVKKIVPLYIITTARKRDTVEWEMECAPFFISKDEDSLVPLHVDSWNNIEKYKDVEGAFFIFDEQRVVSTGKWAMTFVKIARKNKWVLLSATPGDSWIDYWAVFVANGYYRNITDFRQQHVVYRRMAKFPQIERYVGTRKLERLRNDILVTMDFEKTAVRHHEWIKVGYNEDIYRKVMKDRWNVYEDSPIENVSEACYVMRKVVNSDERRLIAVSNLMAKRKSAIIFYNYDYELEMLRRLSDDEGWNYSEWNGHRHQALPSKGKWVYLVQYIAGAEGWNCTKTDSVIFYSQSYSYKMTEQACGRIDRLNTPYTDLYYYHIFSDAPIDKAIKSCLKRKKNFNESAFAFKNLSRENHAL
jgi:hypothetical protein